jgi:DNA-binding transcriptional regulator YiaG
VVTKLLIRSSDDAERTELRKCGQWVTYSNGWIDNFDSGADSHLHNSSYRHDYLSSIFEESLMTTLALALKDEIRRLARKEIKAQTGKHARAVAQYRREIARLKRQQREHEKKIAYLETQARKIQQLPRGVAEHNGDARFSARSVKAQRHRSGLSASGYAKLVGVSPLTIYNWEHHKSRPRAEQFAALVSLRGLGKREAQARLAIMAAADKKPALRRRRPRRKK